MPYKTVSYKTARAIARQPYKRLARKVPAKTKRYVRKAISRMSEAKYKYTTIASHSTGYDVASTTMFQNLTLVDQGDAINEREGNTFEIKSIRIRANIPRFQFQTDSMVAPIRIVVLQWNETSNTNPSLADFGVASTASAYQDVIPNPTSTTYTKRYKILYDRTIQMYDTGGTAPVMSGPGQYMIPIYIPASKLARKTVTKMLTADNNGIGHIFVGAFTNATDASGDDPSIIFTSLIKFKEN